MTKNLIISILIIYGLMISACDSNSTSMDQKETINNSLVRKVELKKNDHGSFRLFVNNEEFYIKGAGLEFGDISALAKHGANSFRTWRVDNGKKTGQEILDDALANDLMVFMGIDVGRERHGSDYNDEIWVQQQLEDIKKDIIKYKDHPALLGWGIGNELNHNYANKKVWNAVNDISQMIHDVDRNHPTTTMLSGIKKEDIDYIGKNCTDIDFISIQMYGDIINLQLRIQEAGYDGPYMVTEWGATGHWEVESTEWGAPIEQNSSEKALGIMDRYEKAITVDTLRCIGSYVFLWGQKQERTPTWFGLFTDNQEETEAIDVMHYYWNEKNWPVNGTPRIKEVSLNGKKAANNIKVETGEELTLTYVSEDPELDSLTWRFEVMPESTDLKEGGDFENKPNELKGLVLSEELGKVTFKAPGKKGAYRAFVYVLDRNQHAGTVNIPFFVN
jgi:hypothetical protein